MSKTPQRVNAVDEGQRLVGLVEVRGDDQAAAGLQHGLLPVDAQLAGGDLGAAGGIHHEHGRLVGDEGPQPPPVAVLAVDVFEHLPAGFIGMHMPGGPAMHGDRGRPRRDQRRDLLQRPAQGARGHLEPVGGQRRDDPVHRPAQHMLLIRQPRQEPGSEQALSHRPGRRRRADRRGPRMRTPPPVAAPPPHDPGDLHLPVDLLAVLGAQELKRLPALRAAPLAGTSSRSMNRSSVSRCERSRRP